MPLQGARKWSLTFTEDIVDGKLGEKKDLNHVKGKVVLIKRGKVTFYEKVKNAKQAGAIAVIIYNNTKGSFAAGSRKRTGYSCSDDS